ncbi:MAG: hypothetical protein JO249_11460, partial [Acidobacteria bacterium]|nr:hypothetical protein [Acidobacteriota bacterium]
MRSVEPATGLAARTRFGHLVRNLLFAGIGLVLVVTAALLWYVHTDSFRSLVRRHLVSALQTITGGRIELAKLTIAPFRLRVEAYNLTIHGTEAADQLPYAHADRLSAEIKIISLVEREYGFRSLAIDHPVVHIIVHRDGSTNQPTPRASLTRKTSPLEELFAISINHLEAGHGELVWNDRKIPLDLRAHDLSLALNYSLLHRNYQAVLRARNVETRLAAFPPLVWSVATQVILGQNDARISSFEWSSGQSHLEASGRLESFSEPRLALTYAGRLDLADLAALGKLPGVHSGMLEIAGKGNWAVEDFFVSGRAAVKNVEWREPNFLLPNASGSASYAASSSALKISDIQARVLGGTASGHVEAVDWLGWQATPGKHLTQQNRGSVNLKIKGISIASLAAAVKAGKLPLRRLHVAGLLEGSVASHWFGSVERAETSFSLAVIPPPPSPANEIPLAANADGIYRASSDELELANLKLATRSSILQASGKLARSALLRLSLTTTDLHEWQPIVDAFGGPELPVTLHGRASFSGDARGRLRDFAVAGRVEASNFETLLRTSATTPPPRFHWDTLAADLRASPQAISVHNGMLAHGATSIHFDSSASLLRGELSATSQILLHLRVHQAQLADLESLTGYNYPVTGTVELSLTAAGTRSNPHGDGHVELKDGTFYGQPLARLSSDLHFAGDEIQLNNTAAVYRDGGIAGGISYNSATRGFHFILSGKNFELLHFTQLHSGKIRIGGKLDFVAHGDGSLDAPIVNANIHLRDLTFDNERAGDFTFNAVTHEADIELTGRSNFANAQLAIDGGIHMRGNWPARLALRFEAFDLDSLLRPYLGAHVTSHVPAAGNLQLSGPLVDPGRLTAVGELTSFSASLENLLVHNEGPIHFTVKDRVLALNRLRLVGDGTDLTADGTAQLDGNHDLDLRSDGRLNLKVIEGIVPGLSGGGLVSIAVRVNGTYESPLLVGKLAVENGSVSYLDLPNGLSEMNGSLVFNQDRLQIETLNARVGGGNVSFSGFMAYSPHINFNVSADAHGVRLRPAGISATSDAELHLTGTSQDALLSGEVTVLKLNLTPNFDFARYLEGLRQTTTLPESSSLLNGLRVDIHVVTTPELEMEAAAAKVSGDADL